MKKLQGQKLVGILDKMTRIATSMANVNMLFTGWEVRIDKNCARGLDHTDRGRRPRSVFKTEGIAFLYTGRLRPLNIYLIIFVF